MTTTISSNASAFRPPVIVTALGAMFALSIAGAVLMGSITPAAAAKQGGQNRAAQTALVPKPVIRDHRTPRAEPNVRDHRNGVQVRDHRGSLNGGKHRTPCLGNLC